MLKNFYYETQNIMKYLDKAIEFLEENAPSIELERAEDLTKEYQERHKDDERLSKAHIFLVRSSEEDRGFREVYKEGARIRRGEKGKKSYAVLDRNEEEGWIAVEADFTKEATSTSSQENTSNSSIIKVVPNTYQIRVQKDAIMRLRERPFPEHKPLLWLFGKQEAPFWKGLEEERVSEQEIQWFILKDDSKEGTQDQRSFIEKALRAPAFALLEGPPGSGKTTTIIELILQFVSRGKRVLLVSSTHAAIDNVIERIDDRYKDVCKDYVQPIRIGRDISMIKENVQNYLLDRMVKRHRKEIVEFLTSKEKNKMSKSQMMLYDYIQSYPKDTAWIESLILESVNLVAGTTIGILRSPYIRGEFESVPFDVMIMDEASKATLLDFLVPALYAKKWILVGDVKQLSPYVDNDIIGEWIHALLEEEESFAQVRRFYLWKSINEDENKVITHVLITPEPNEDADWVEKVEERERAEKHENDLGIRTPPYVLIKKPDGNVQELSDMIYKINGSHVVIASSPNFFLDNHACKSRIIIAADEERIPSHKLERLEMVQSALWEKDAPPFVWEVREKWGDMIAQRMNQIFMYRRVKKDITKHIRREMEILIPIEKYDEIEKELKNIQRLFFPSILEMLQEGIGKRMEKYSDIVLTMGLPEVYKSKYFDILRYQYRMHDDIARISREYFYDSESLYSAKVNNTRPWDYEADKRVVWVRLSENPKAGSRIINREEVSKIQEVLKRLNDHFTKKGNQKCEVAILSFYADQVQQIRHMLRKLTRSSNYSRFQWESLVIYLYTVDKFQGQEADVVLLGFTKFSPMAHYNSPNRLNVAITRARHKLYLFGHVEKLKSSAKLPALQALAKEYPIIQL